MSVDRTVDRGHVPVASLPHYRRLRRARWGVIDARRILAEIDEQANADAINTLYEVQQRLEQTMYDMRTPL